MGEAVPIPNPTSPASLNGVNGNVRFGVFEVDVRAGELRKSGVRIRLQAQPFDVLVTLLESPGQVVTREQLQQRLWAGDTFVDFEHGLNKAINKLREALGDDADNPRFIETLPRRGYRFVAPVLAPAQPTVEGAQVPADDATEKETAAPVGARHHPIRLIAFVVVAIVVAGLVTLWLKPPALPTVTGTTQITNDGVPKVGGGGWCCPGAVGTDGPRVYFPERTPQGWRIAQAASTGGNTMLVGSPFDRFVGLLDLIPGRSEILIGMGVELDAPLWVLSAPSGAAQKVGDLVVQDAAWSPDGNTLIYTKGHDIFLAKADGSGSRKLVTAEHNPFRPRLSPDGKVIRFTQWDPTVRTPSSLWEVSIDGSNLHPLFPERTKRSECCGIWTSDGKYYIFQSTLGGATNLWAIRERQGVFQKAMLEPIPLTTGPVNFLSPALSVDEKRVYALGTQPRGELMRYDRAAGNFVPYLAGLSVEGLDFSRDGEWLTYVTYPEGVLWRSRVDGSQPLQLTDASMWAGLPRWSPDAKRIAFTASRSGGLRKIYVVSAEGGGAEEIIPGEGAQFDPSWSPDGNSLAFGEDFWKFDGVIRIIDLKTRQISVIPGSEGLFSPRWSTDGRFLLALGHILQNSQKLMMYDFATRKWQQLAEGKSIDYPVWSRNRDYVYFSSLLDNGTPNRRVRISDRKVEQITEVNLPRGLTSGQFGSWTGLAPDDSPLLLRDTSIQEIYALDVELP